MRAAWVLLLVALPAWAGQMYKCVDSRGVTHYSELPLADCKGREVDIRGSPPISGELERPRAKGGMAGEEADFNRRQNERAEAAAAERAALEKRCRSMRLEHARLSGGQRLAQVNERGEPVYVPDEVREQRLAQLREALRACP